PVQRHPYRIRNSEFLPAPYRAGQAEQDEKHFDRPVHYAAPRVAPLPGPDLDDADPWPRRHLEESLALKCQEGERIAVNLVINQKVHGRTNSDQRYPKPFPPQFSLPGGGAVLEESLAGERRDEQQTVQARQARERTHQACEPPFTAARSQKTAERECQESTLGITNV